MNYRIDTTPTTAVALCACGSRFLALSRPAALARLAEHERVWHPADKDVRTKCAPSNTPAARGQRAKK